MENSNVTGKVVRAIMIGTLLGASLGLLFAPYKGSRTRNRISRRSKNLAFKLREEANVLLRKAEKLESRAEMKIQNLVEKAEEGIDNLKY